MVACFSLLPHNGVVGRIMNSKVAGSILTVFPVIEQKRFFSRICKTQLLKNNDERNTIIASHSNTEQVGVKIGYWVSHRGS